LLVVTHFTDEVWLAVHLGRVTPPWISPPVTPTNGKESVALEEQVTADLCGEGIHDVVANKWVPHCVTVV
jgi:hypothetical protein